MKRYMNNAMHAAKEKWLPTSTVSTFKCTGAMTPQEFLMAGDELTHLFPLWQWQGSDFHAKEYLPSDKQYLKSGQLISTHRYKDTDVATVEEVEHEFSNMTFTTTQQTQHVENWQDSSVPIDEDVYDWEEETVVEDEDTSILMFEQRDTKFQQCRTYTLTITYDKVYQTPRLWVNGRDSWMNVLHVKHMLEDISSDHVGKTVTIETHPYTKEQCLSIHPCQQTSLLKKLIAEGEVTTPAEAMQWIIRVMITVLPTIDFVGYS